MRTLSVFLFLLFPVMMQAQEVVATAGSTFSNENGSISFTIGESVANTLINGEKTVTQGFHQTSISVSAISELINPGFSISAFPNPAVDKLTLSIGKNDIADLQYLLVDINGKVLSQKQLESSETAISVKELAKGMYILKIQAGQKELKTFKIIKQ